MGEASSLNVLASSAPCVLQNQQGGEVWCAWQKFPSYNLKSAVGDISISSFLVRKVFYIFKETPLSLFFFHFPTEAINVFLPLLVEGNYLVLVIWAGNNAKNKSPVTLTSKIS